LWLTLVGVTWLDVETSVIQAGRLTLPAARWIGTGVGVSGARLIALNLGVVGDGFVLFLAAAVWHRSRPMNRNA
jgi:hypothetical protein